MRSLYTFWGGTKKFWSAVKLWKSDRTTYEFFKKIGKDKMKRVKLFSVNQVMGLKEEQLQEIVKYFEENEKINEEMRE